MGYVDVGCVVLKARCDESDLARRLDDFCFLGRDLVWDVDSARNSFFPRFRFLPSSDRLGMERFAWAWPEDVDGDEHVVVSLHMQCHCYVKVCSAYVPRLHKPAP